jgi:hypothetical protein
MAKLFRAGLEETEFIDLNHMWMEPAIPERQIMVERIADESGDFKEYTTDDEMRRLLITATIDTIEEVQRLEVWSVGTFTDLSFEDQDGNVSDSWRIRPDYPMNVSAAREGFPNRKVTMQIERGY